MQCFVDSRAIAVARDPWYGEADKVRDGAVPFPLRL